MNPSHIAACALLALPACTFAALGSTADSVQSDQVKMKAASRISRSVANFTVEQMQLASGTTVREYVAANGQVFGVAWNGPVKPDLQQVLGQYFSALSDPTAIKHGNHSQLHLQKGALVIHSSGHMRAFSGHAYLTTALPQGVTASDIQ